MKNLDDIISMKELPSDSDELLMLIKESINCATMYKAEIEKLKKANQNGSKHQIKQNINSESSTINYENISANDGKDYVSDITSLYYDDYSKLPYDFTEEALIGILPSRNNVHFKNVIMKLHAESFKIINDIFEYINDLDSRDEKEEKLELKKMLEHEKRKISLLQTIYNKEDDITSEEIRKNRIVLIQRNSGSVIPISDLDEIPSEYYGQLYDLISSIIDGTFKGLKLLKSNYRLKKVYELKMEQLRVIFNKLDKNTYAIITVFVKKIDRDNYYVDFINTRANHYNAVRANIVSGLNDPKFISMNEENVAKFLNILNPIETPKKYTKNLKVGDSND